MMRPETVKHICSEWCSIDEKGWKIFVVKKKVEVSMSSFILLVVKHTLILHTLCQVWNKLWSFILYVVEKNLEDIFKIFFLEEFFSCKTKKMKMLLLVSGSINSSKTNVRVVQVKNDETRNGQTYMFRMVFHWRKGMKDFRCEKESRS